MLKTAFIGNRNTFDERICEWLSEHTDLSLIIWTNKLGWSGGSASVAGRAFRLIAQRRRRVGMLRALNEALYYAIYRNVLQAREQRQITAAIESVTCRPRKPLAEIKQLCPDNIKDAEVQQAIEDAQLDAMFAMCIAVYLPASMIKTPRLGTFLWHEGITPEYRGVYSPFWALVRREYDMLGYTLLQMNSKLDAGQIFLQGRAENIDPTTDWHGYIGHKAILDSLPRTKGFLQDLEHGNHRPLERPEAIDGYYSYPTGTALLKIFADRALGRGVPVAEAGGHPPVSTSKVHGQQ